ncbi:MAG: hypothetical protein HYV63_24245 [Candidatus Schekmanbacteria bacterium]|nr:hypothetical protein [Candidatus Schekmanbacteria bacterium]
MSNDAAPEKNARGQERAVRLALAFSAWRLALHLWQRFASGDPRLMPPHAVAYLHDVPLLSGLRMAAARRLLPASLRAGGELIAVALLFLSGTLLAIYRSASGSLPGRQGRCRQRSQRLSSSAQRLRAAVWAVPHPPHVP